MRVSGVIIMNWLSFSIWLFSQEVGAPIAKHESAIFLPDAEASLEPLLCVGVGSSIQEFTGNTTLIKSEFESNFVN